MDDAESELSGLREFIDRVRLDSVQFHEVSARRFDSDRGGADGDISIEVQINEDSDRFGVRLRGMTQAPAGEAVVSVAGEYVIEDGIAPSSRVIKQFVNEVAVMAVLPYLREGIATITAKVFGTPLNLPIISRGAITVDID
ncbi:MULTISPECIES: hypothetical protein [unclassified Brevibacterium]|uniref:hypothetical protein n=1 Tax=unclassified Brevibacterium TaxID=2614124 RepID=UPI001091C258|nr:hypothetical protein [Brevibacterium sp. S22]